MALKSGQLILILRKQHYIITVYITVYRLGPIVNMKLSLKVMTKLRLLYIAFGNTEKYGGTVRIDFVNIIGFRS